MTERKKRKRKKRCDSTGLECRKDLANRYTAQKVAGGEAAEPATMSIKNGKGTDGIKNRGPHIKVNEP